MLLFGRLAGARRARPRRFRLFNARLDDYLTENDVKSRFRFGRDSINYLVDLLSDDLARNTARNHALSPLVQVLVALRFFASGSFLEVIGDTFGLPKSTVSRCITAVSQALVRRQHMFIVWPDEDRKTVIKQAFFAKNGFPGVIGCIDCTHIRIQAPRVNENDFVNRKGYHSLNVQAICDHKGEYTVGYWGQRVPMICFVCPVVQNFSKKYWVVSQNVDFITSNLHRSLIFWKLKKILCAWGLDNFLKKNLKNELPWTVENIGNVRRFKSLFA